MKLAIGVMGSSGGELASRTARGATTSQEGAMNKIMGGLVGVCVLVAASTGAAQTKPMAPEGSHSHGSEAGQMPSTQMPMMSPEMMAMMCSRMERQMGPGMMGGMMAPSDPKTQARMLRFRADMMKAMSDVMLRHAAELEKEK